MHSRHNPPPTHVLTWLRLLVAGDVQPAAITHTSLIQDFAAMYTANNPDSTWDEINKAYPDEIDAFVERLAEE